MIQFFSGKTKSQWEYVISVAEQFRESAIALHAIQVQGLMAHHLLRYGRSMSLKLVNAPSSRQMSLDESD